MKNLASLNMVGNFPFQLAMLHGHCPAYAYLYRDLDSEGIFFLRVQVFVFYVVPLLPLGYFASQRSVFDIPPAPGVCVVEFFRIDRPRSAIGTVTTLNSHSKHHGKKTRQSYSSQLP